MLEFFEDYRISKTRSMPIDENAVEIDMMKWIELNGKTIATLLEEANIPYHLLDDALLILTDLELSTIVNMFCAKGKGFTSDNFKKEMAEMEVKPLVYHKIFKVLNQWKNEAMSNKENYVNVNIDSSISTIEPEDNEKLVVLNML